MKTTLTQHSVQRLGERASVTSIRDAKDLSSKARAYGRSEADFDGAFANFLRTHYRKTSNNTRIKVYSAMIFVFGGKDSKKLITAVNVPGNFIESASKPSRDTRFKR